MVNYLHILEVFHTFNCACWSLLLTKFTYVFLLLYFYLVPISLLVHNWQFCHIGESVTIEFSKNCNDLEEEMGPYLLSVHLLLA